MEHQESSVTIYLSDLWDVFVRHIIVILLVAAVFMAGVMVYATRVVKPLYNSTATLYVLRQDDDANYSSSDFSLALNLVNDCTYMLKSHAVLDDVMDELKLDMSYSELSSSISTRNPDSSRILEVSVKTGDAQLSKRIVDKLCKIGAERISDTMRMDQISVFENGTLETRPCNGVGIVRYVLAGLLGAILCYLVFVVAFLLDDKIKTEEDVKRYLNLSVLGEIPYTSGSTRRSAPKSSKAALYKDKGKRSRKGGKRG